MKTRHALYFGLMLTLPAGSGCGRGQTTSTRSEQASVSSTDLAGSAEPTAAVRRRQGLARRARRGPGAFGTGRHGWGRIELTPEERKVVDVGLVPAGYRPVRAQLQAMGKVLAHQHRKAIVNYAFPARISRIHVAIGQWVKAGQELVTLQSEAVGEAKSAFYKARADFDLARVNHEREKRLYERGVGAQKNLQTAEAGLAVAEVSLNAAEKKLHVLGFSEEQVRLIAESHQINPSITLFAPIAGKVIQNAAVLGAMVDQTTEIMTVMDGSVLCADAEVFERDIAQVRVGQAVEVNVPAYPGEAFGGRVSYIGDVLKEDTRTVSVRTEIDNREQKLKPGMFATLSILLSEQRRALVVPEEAVLDDGNDRIAFLEEGGGYQPILVKAGRREAGMVEIVEGVTEGEKVVTKGAFQLKSRLFGEALKQGHIH